MRILFLTRKWAPAMGGMEIYSQEMSAEFRRLGHEVDLRALPGRADGGAPGAAAILGFGLGQARRLALGAGRWDLVFTGDLAIWPLAALALRAARRGGARPALLLSAHGTDAAFAARPTAPGRAYGAYMRRGARALAAAAPGPFAVAANSGATAVLTRALGFDHVGIIPLGVRARAPDPAPPERREILFAGRLVRRKGLSWFVQEVLPHLPADLPLAVAGTAWDKAEAAALAHPRVVFLGALPQEELWARMAAATVVAVPNLAAGQGHVEGFGLVAAEAAAAGGIVLAPRLEGFASSVIEGETGTLLPPGDGPAWAAEITRIAALPPASRAALRARARDAAAARFDWSRCARETLALVGA
ncbi:glycosyltransferase family 4 protein [Rhodovulum sp. DZ06]|uniref:glycosyltransferase family 4 protein n=1 Tax=Rhodovulum sp. DZ06 TaxID=3425126 RepID=UPI003D329831